MKFPNRNPRRRRPDPSQHFTLLPAPRIPHNVPPTFRHAAFRAAAAQEITVHRFRFMLSAAVIVLLATASLRAQAPQPFSADFTTNGSAAHKITGKWYFAPPKVRIDVNPTPGERSNDPMAGNMTMLIDGAAHTNYMLMHQQHMYMDMHGSEQNFSPALRNMLQQKGGIDPCAYDAERSCKKIGEETVNGRNCDKWEVIAKNSDKNIICMDQKLHFPIKIQSGNGDLTELSNIKEGAPDSSLFTLPPDYKPFDPAAFQKRRP